MEAKTLTEVIRQMHADAFRAPRHSRKQYVLPDVQSIYSEPPGGVLPEFYANALSVCQVAGVAFGQVQAAGKLLAEARGAKTVDIEITVRFGNTTCYLQSLKILKTSLISTDEETLPPCHCSPQGR
jgi:hypothetical protein